MASWKLLYSYFRMVKVKGRKYEDGVCFILPPARCLRILYYPASHRRRTVCISFSYCIVLTVTILKLLTLLTHRWSCTTCTSDYTVTTGPPFGFIYYYTQASPQYPPKYSSDPGNYTTVVKDCRKFSSLFISESLFERKPSLKRAILSTSAGPEFFSRKLCHSSN